MHGFIIRGIELFLRTRHGDEVWAKVSSAAGIDRRGTMLMRIYPDEVAARLLDATSTELQISRDELLEDIGGWIPRLDSVRHIMRFSGSSLRISCCRSMIFTTGAAWCFQGLSCRGSPHR